MFLHRGISGIYVVMMLIKLYENVQKLTHAKTNAAVLKICSLVPRALCKLMIQVHSESIVKILGNHK